MAIPPYYNYFFRITNTVLGDSRLSDPLNQLHYQPAKKTISRKIRDRLIAAVVIAVVFLITLWFGPSAMKRVELLYWQRRCSNYPSQSDQIVYTYHPEKGQAAAIQPIEWQRYSDLAGFKFTTGDLAVFIHSRTSPNGTSRIVMVGAGGTPLDWDKKWRISLNGQAIVPGGLFAMPGTTSQSMAQNIVRFFDVPAAKQVIYRNGRIDPDDSSHFTLEMDADDQRFTTDGWLRDDDTVLLETRPSVPIPPPTSLPVTFP